MAEEHQLTVVDASVIAKWFLIEAQSDHAEAMRDDYVGGKLTLAAPDILPYEVLNAVRFSKKSIGMSELRLLGRSLILYGIQLRRMAGEYLELTLQVSLRSGITVYDASYVALAEELRSVLYTADEQLIDGLSREDKSFVKHLSEYG